MVVMVGAADLSAVCDAYCVGRFVVTWMGMNTPLQETESRVGTVLGIIEIGGSHSAMVGGGMVLVKYPPRFFEPFFH
jgi:hypothetical protein